MFKDISLTIDNNKINYEYSTKEGTIIIKTTDELKIKSILRIFYDENIYEIKLNKNTKFDLGKSGEIFVHLNNKELLFSVFLKKNYFVKSVYKYINELINKKILVEEINIFLNSQVGKNYRKDLNDLLLSIKNNNDYKTIFNLLVNNETYLNISRNMNDLELMLLITSYISVPIVPKINQEIFNNLILTAENYDNNLENVWRLGLNFDNKGYNYDLLDDFFVNSKNIWYLSEYIHSINQVNQEKIINKIIKTNDKEYIKQILKNIFIEEKYRSLLEKNI